MNLQNKQLQLHRKHDALKFQVVTTELDLAITFCLVAKAERACTSAAHLMDGNLNAAQNLEIREKKLFD